MPVDPAARLRRRRQDLSRSTPTASRWRWPSSCKADQADLRHRRRTGLRPPRSAHPPDAASTSCAMLAAAATAPASPPSCCPRRSTPRRPCAAGVPRVHVINGTPRRGAARRGVLQRGPRHADPRQRVPADPPGQEEGRARHPDADPAGGRGRRAGQAHPRRRSSGASADYFIFEIDKNPVACVALHVYPEHEPGRAGLPLRQLRAREPGHRPQADPVRREARARAAASTNCWRCRRRRSRYFQSKGGFVEGTPDDLPPARRERYEQSGRQLQGAGQEARRRRRLTARIARRALRSRRRST